MGKQMEKQFDVLMIEDSGTLSTLYTAYMEDSPYLVRCAADLQSGAIMFEEQVPHIVLLDIELPDGNGMELLPVIREAAPQCEVVIMTAHGTSEIAVRAINQGAFDFLTKPFDAGRLLVTLNNAREHIELNEQVEGFKELELERYAGFVGRSLPMQALYRTLDALAASRATGFIVGESGTGKELAAEAIHQKGNRKGKTFLAINCGAIPGELMESELFGHVKGAFTGATANRDGAATIADGGTLFLDEICEMDLELQKKLLRFIQTGTYQQVGSNKTETVDIRFLCATNRDPLKEVQEGRFREDLFYRLHVVPVEIPALHERGDDVLLLADYFLGEFASREGKSFPGFTSKVKKHLLSYRWPGNVRELSNLVENIVVLNPGNQISEAMLPTSFRGSQATSSLVASGTGSSGINGMAVGTLPSFEIREAIEPLRIIERKVIEHAIETCSGSVNKAAGLLEVAPSTLYRKIQSWSQ